MEPTGGGEPAPAPVRKPLMLRPSAVEFKMNVGASEFKPSFAAAAAAPTDATAAPVVSAPPLPPVVADSWESSAASSSAAAAAPAPSDAAPAPPAALPVPAEAPPAAPAPASPRPPPQAAHASSSPPPKAAAAADEVDAAELIDDFDDADAAAAAARKASLLAADGDPREHLNVVFIGHVDAGKSTLSGSILYHTGQVDARAIEKFEREAKAKNRDSWFLAFIMDTTDEERTKGITVEVGRATFETANKRFTILDAPGHKNYVPNMIAGAAQADVAVLVISARKGEFETGFERGGQTREHAMLAKTLGVRYLIVVVNKMDEPTVKWSKERWDEIVGKLTPFLKQSGYAAKHVTFMPISGISGINVKERNSPAVCPWYDGPSLLEFLDGLAVGGRDADAPLRIPVLDKYSDRGVIIMGKVEAGTLREGAKMLVLPQRTECVVDTVYINDVEVRSAKPGENVKIKIKGAKEEDILRGFVLCDVERPIIPVRQFEAQLMILELDAHSLFTAGYQAVLHVHTAQEEVIVKRLVAEVDKKTGEPKPGPAPKFSKSQGLVIAVLEVQQAICIEKFETMQQMGRFTLRDGMRTVAIGKVLRLGIPKSQQAAYTKYTGGGAGGSGGT